MSRELHDAKLPGWNGPVKDRQVLFSLQHLQNFWECNERDCSIDRELGNRGFARLPGYEGPVAIADGALGPVTSDQYRWYHSAVFAFPEGRLALLVPWSQDWSKQDSSQSDRSMAVYTCGQVAAGEVVALLDNLVYALDQEIRRATAASGFIAQIFPETRQA